MRLSPGVKMAELDKKMNAVLVVPQGSAGIKKSFIDFLWNQRLGAYLATTISWASPPADKKTQLGVMVSPGSC